MTQRLNARIDRELSRKVKILRERLGGSTTDIVKASIETYYDQVTRRQRPAELLSDFVACGRASADLSETYKARLTESLKKKSRA